MDQLNFLNTVLQLLDFLRRIKHLLLLLFHVQHPQGVQLLNFMLSIQTVIIFNIQIPITYSALKFIVIPSFPKFNSLITTFSLIYFLELLVLQNYQHPPIDSILLPVMPTRILLQKIHRQCFNVFCLQTFDLQFYFHTK